MTCLGYHDGFHIVNVLVGMVTYWIRPTKVMTNGKILSDHIFLMDWAIGSLGRW